MSEILSSILALIGTVAGVLGKLVTSDRCFKLLLAGISAVWAAYFLLIGALSGGAIMLASFFRQILSINLDRESIQRRRIMVVAFTLFFLSVSLNTWEGVQSVFPLIAIINATWAMFYLSGTGLRWQLIIGSDLAWLIYDLYYASAYGHALMILCAISVGLYAIKAKLASA